MKACLIYLIPLAFTLTSLKEEQLFASPTPPSKQEMQKNPDPGIVVFIPPSGWHYAEQANLPPSVKAMVVGKAPTSIPPAINISCEPYKGTLKQYLKIVKNMNASRGEEWKDLGSIQTQAGSASLSQVDAQTPWGILRKMQTIIIKHGYVYILTASALKNEFSIFYKEFFASLRSLKITKDLYEMVSNNPQRIQLKTAVNKLKTEWKRQLLLKQKENKEGSPKKLDDNAFNDKHFQGTLWTPFKEMVSNDFTQMGTEWHALLLQQIENELKELKKDD